MDNSKTTLFGLYGLFLHNIYCYIFRHPLTVMMWYDGSVSQARYGLDRNKRSGVRGLKSAHEYHIARDNSPTVKMQDLMSGLD